MQALLAGSAPRPQASLGINKPALTKALYCLGALGAATIPVFSGLALTINDDAAALALIQAGEAHTVIVSFALSKVLVFLYAALPAVPWYSATLAAALVIAALIAGSAAAELHGQSPRGAFFFFSQPSPGSFTSA